MELRPGPVEESLVVPEPDLAVVRVDGTPQRFILVENLHTSSGVRRGNLVGARPRTPGVCSPFLCSRPPEPEAGGGHGPGVRRYPVYVGLSTKAKAEMNSSPMGS